MVQLDQQNPEVPNFLIMPSSDDRADYADYINCHCQSLFFDIIVYIMTKYI